MARGQAEIQIEHLPNVTDTPACSVLVAKENEYQELCKNKKTLRVVTWRVLRFRKPDTCSNLSTSESEVFYTTNKITYRFQASLVVPHHLLKETCPAISTS
jgi:hypothetical protein